MAAPNHLPSDLSTEKTAELRKRKSEQFAKKNRQLMNQKRYDVHHRKQAMKAKKTKIAKGTFSLIENAPKHPPVRPSDCSLKRKYNYLMPFSNGYYKPTESGRVSYLKARRLCEPACHRKLFEGDAQDEKVNSIIPRWRNSSKDIVEKLAASPSSSPAKVLAVANEGASEQQQEDAEKETWGPLEKISAVANGEASKKSKRLRHKRRAQARRLRSF